jgi:hypothetical protein
VAVGLDVAGGFDVEAAQTADAQPRGGIVDGPAFEDV